MRVRCQRDCGFTRLVGDRKALANEARSHVGKLQGLILGGGCECAQGEEERNGKPAVHASSLPCPLRGQDHATEVGLVVLSEIRAE